MASKSSQRNKATHRKLTAILCADVVGYSRLMGADEEATIETLTAYRKVFTSQIKKHRGRVVDAKGDAILAEFASVVDAVNGAVEIQRELAEKNADIPDDRRMDVRIGINLGDVVVKDDVIYGDGVNIAARLESLAEPGGICISRPVYDQVESKLNLECEYLGEQQVKNIAKPVRAYKVVLEQVVAATAMPGSGSPPPKPISTQEKRPRKAVRPTLAVLPFANIGGDPEQEYFSDGITEDLITDLSKISRLSVTASNTSFTYKGRAVNVREAGKELDVEHVLEGSVRKAGKRVRISAQLIDTATGDHVWAERYDRELDHIFEIQDEITRHIVTALDVKLVEGEQARIWRKTSTNAEAYDLFLQARDAGRRGLSRQWITQRLRLLQQSAELDPNFASVYVDMALVHQAEARLGWSDSPESSLERSFEMATRALDLDDSLAMPHTIIGLYYLNKRQYERALSEGEKGVSMAPTSAQVLYHLARIQMFAGIPAQAVETLRRSMEVSPTFLSGFGIVFGAANVFLGRYEEAVAAMQDLSVEWRDNLWLHIYLAAAHAGLGQGEDAEKEMREVYRVDPNFDLEEWGPRALLLKDQADLERIMGLLRKAGLK